MINICFSFYYYQILKRLFVFVFPLRQEEHLPPYRLGSGSAVTDDRGRAVHVLGYMHYGETLIDLAKEAARHRTNSPATKKTKRQARTTPKPATTRLTTQYLQLHRPDVVQVS